MSVVLGRNIYRQRADGGDQSVAEEAVAVHGVRQVASLGVPSHTRLFIHSLTGSNANFCATLLQASDINVVEKITS